MSQQQNGQLMQADFVDNTGGINISDSVFKIKESQAAGGFNFDYTLTGGVRKRLGPTPVNTAADTLLKTLGLGLHHTSAAVKTVIRATDTLLQAVDTTLPSFTALTQDDSTPNTAPFVSGSTQPVATVMFNSATANVLWCAGGGATLPVGAVSTTQWTVNGTAAPKGVFNLTHNSAAGGSFVTTGNFWYGLMFRKRSTQAQSNVALDVMGTVAATTDTFTLNWSGLTNLDATLYDQVWVWRSAVNGVEGFTTGSIIAQLDSTVTTYTDTGTSVLDAENVPRVNNVVLDNSVLPAGTYNPLCLFKQRLVTATGSTVYLSEVNKSESWPGTNNIEIPSGGDIKAMSVISFTSPQAQTLDEILCIFKERELWVITGDDYTNWALKFIDEVGCSSQELVVTANGFLSWVDYRGIYLWDGAGKPIYCSRPLEPLFGHNGDLDKTKLSLGHAVFHHKENQITWYLSSRIYGEQQFAIKMDTRLTLPSIEQNLTGRTIDGVFTLDFYAFPIYASMSYILGTGSDESVLLGDISGYCYTAGTGYADGATADYAFTYKTAPLHMGNPNQVKLFHTAIAWVEDVGNWNLELDSWTNYKVGVDNQSTKIVPISDENQSAAGLWDIAYWDTAYYDSYESNVIPVIFNLDNSQGTSIQLQWRNATANQPVTIHGWSVLWSPLGGVL